MSESRPLHGLWGQGRGLGYDFTPVTHEAGEESSTCVSYVTGRAVLTKCFARALITGHLS